jgi:L-lactate dehydrogenase complex protein LldF
MYMISTAKQSFVHDAEIKAHDMRHRAILQKATHTHAVGVDKGKLRFVDWEDARSQAARIKWDAINHLDKYLEQFEANVLKRGGHVAWAETGEQCRDYVLDLCKRKDVKKVVKSKSMASEEIHLNEIFHEHDIEPIETDLGEYIVQLRNEPPYHIVTPAMHLTRGDIGQLFKEKLGANPDSSAEELAGIARGVMRNHFLTADMGITGGNFLIAETGSVVTCTNEGNARLGAGIPKIHVAIVGIEKVLPKMEDLALFLPLLATSGTGQALTVYNTIWNGPRQPDEPDGPEEFHVILMDNGRTNLLADAEQREALHCIRCGACLNACPIFKNVGGHTYGTTYQGPIGSVITPHLRGLEEFKHLSYASSLCGNCSEVCPVHIDLHHHLLQNRRNSVRAGFGGTLERIAFEIWAWAMADERRYRLAGKLGRIGQMIFSTPAVKGSAIDPMRGWTETREFPMMPEQSFKDWWRNREQRS